MKKSEGCLIFGKNVCYDRVLKRYMKGADYRKYISLKEKNLLLSTGVADKVAHAMKCWAIKKGATHYTHWFAPLGGKMAEKRTAFLDKSKKRFIYDCFNKSALVKGEVDASSLPNGGSRSTFEARGYTVWDYESPAFIKEDFSGSKILCIPAMFCSYDGVVLDEKTPLCRAIESVNAEALKILKILGYKNVKRVICNIGAEQEYFLIKNEVVSKRLDLKTLEKTIFGSKVHKRQDMSGHYLGVIDDDVSGFMAEVDEQLWKLGILSKIQHNEVAPKQFEIVPVFSEANIACDQNQLVMEVVKKTAKRYGFEAIFNESPFIGVNGSGKHVNLSIVTDTGINLFDCLLNDRKLFLLFCSAMVAGVNKFYKLLSASVTSWGNEFRLGGGEAPPKMFSMSIGEGIVNLFESLKTNSSLTNENEFKFKDSSDRNRTTPFAYNGNKFEFRMVGAAQNISWPCTCILSVLAKELKEISEKLESVGDNNSLIDEIICENYNKNKNIIFNGDGYNESWLIEAEKRGLKKVCDGTEAFSIYEEQQVVELFEEMGVLSERELLIRKKVSEKTYYDLVELEVKIMIQMVRESILPNLFSFVKSLKNCDKEVCRVIELSVKKLQNNCKELESLLKITNKDKNIEKFKAKMKETRSVFDEVENLLPLNLKPFPTYNEILMQ